MLGSPVTELLAAGTVSLACVLDFQMSDFQPVLLLTPGLLCQDFLLCAVDAREYCQDSGSILGSSLV